MKRLGVILSISILLCGGIIGCGGDEEADLPDNQHEQASTALESNERDALQTAGFSEGVVALVNGQPIMAEELSKRFHAIIEQNDLDSATSPDEYTLYQLKEGALQELVQRTLIAQQAKEQGVTVSAEEIQQRVQQVQAEYNETAIETILQEQGQTYVEWEKAQRENILMEKLTNLNMGSMITVSDEEVRQYYERHEEHYDHPAQIRASQILTYDRERADRALQEIRDGRHFAEVARRYSESSDAQDGGNLGFFAKGVMPPEFDEVLFNLKMGEVSDVVKTPYGYQIFQLTGQREAHRVSFDEAQAQIRSKLEQQKRMFAIDLWITELQANSDIQINHELLTQIR